MSKHLSVLSLSVAVAATLAACGGGGGGGAAPPPPVGTVTLTGIAARGAALAGASVSVKCAGGNGSATTAASGAYSVAISGASLPCALQVTGTDGTVLHSLRAGSESSGSFNVNITPLTELVVARAAVAAPSTFFTTYAIATAPSTATVTQAIDAVRTATTGVVDLTGINPISDTLVAAYGSTAGNALDQKIDALGTALTAARTTLAQVSSALVANPTSTSVVATILQPAATGCAWLRSGKYRMITPGETDPQWAYHVLDLNATTLKATLFNGTVISLVDQGGCKFTADGGSDNNTFVVSSAGVLVVQSVSKSNAADVSVAVGLPEQTLAASDFAGTWNTALWQSASSSSQTDYYAETLEVAFNSGGTITDVATCEGLAACVPEPGAAATMRANTTAGGFDFVEQGAVSGRAFLFKTAAGRPTFVLVLGDGAVLVGTPKQTLGTLPAVGDVSSFRELALRGNGVVDLWVDNSTTVTAVNTGTRQVTRRRAADNRIDTLGFDQPRDGLRYRAANSCSTNGTPTNCAQTVQIPLQGIGITLSLSVGTTMPAAQSFFNVSVGRPSN